MASPITPKARVAYFLAWLPMAALVATILHQRGLSVVASLVTGLALSVPYSLVCGSTYYMCRAMPLDRAKALQVLPRLIVSAVAAGGIWAAAAYVVAMAVGDDLGARLAGAVPVLFGLGVTFFTLSLAFHYLILGLEKVHRVEQEANEAAVLGREAELRALRAQLDPHFLFNSLNSVSALISIDPAAARDMCRELSDFFRETLRLGDRASVTLAEELDLVRGYLTIEGVRFQDRLTRREEIDEAFLGVRMPPLILQPLVENAVKHGAAGRLEPTEILIAVRRDGDGARVTVSNPYDEAPRKAGARGHGLRIVRERLSGFYGRDARLVVGREGGVFTAAIHLPAGNNGEEP